MPSPSIDPKACTSLLVRATRQLAAAGESLDRPRDVPAGIDWIRKASRKSAQGLRGRLDALYPAIGWMEEDGAHAGTASTYWLYDAIDGAYHYLQGLPLWSSSLALVHDDRIVFSAVYSPSTKEVFMACEGRGATCNGKQIWVSSKTDLRSAVAGTAVAPVLQVGRSAQARALECVSAIAPQVFVLRAMASASLQLAFVAAGRLDLHWETGLDAQDWLAGALLVREAGGRASDLSGATLSAQSEGIVAAPASLHGTIVALLHSASLTSLAIREPACSVAGSPQTGSPQ